ncbi:hypothetical protein D3C87_1859540 [compost metagenome]
MGWYERVFLLVAKQQQPKFFQENTAHTDQVNISWISISDNQKERFIKQSPRHQFKNKRCKNISNDTLLT